MELKNIHNRKDFIKINEFIAGQQGGVGASDGFANNAKLKDTYLGKLVNGIFKGIGWLWRKSKELFIINRLIAQLVNELLRGIILFCFDNNINLSDGKQSKPNQAIEGAEGSDFSESGEESLSGTTASEQFTGTTVSGTTTETTNVEKEELVKRIESLKIGIDEDTKKVKSLEGQIRQLETNLNTMSYTVKEKAEKEKILEKLKKELEEQKEGLKIGQEELNKLNQQLKIITDKEYSTISFDKIRNACEDKYEFSPTAEYLPKYVEFGAITLPQYEKTLREKRYKAKSIQIGDEFMIINKEGRLENIKVYNVDNSSGKIWYFSKGEKKLTESNNIKLLPKDFPGFKRIKDVCLAFLRNHVSEYDTMTDQNKLKMEKIYMQYSLIDQLSKVQRSAISNESLEFLNEESLVKNVASKVSTAGTAKVKPDNPQAGKVGLGTSIAMKVAGKSATVGNILTKRDRDKYKEEKGEEFKLNIHNVNLAEIEKTIQSLEKTDSDVKMKVSTYVNPYNLKTIQISAEQLLAPRKTAEGVDNNEELRMRWNKEVNKTYAAFTNIMNIEKVNITKDDFGNKLNNDKVELKANGLTDSIKAQQSSAQITSTLQNILEPGYNNYTGMETGKFAIYTFTFNKQSFTTSIAPVGKVFDKFGLLNMTSCFSAVDSTTNSITENPNFEKIFSTKNSDRQLSTPQDIKVYFLFKHKQTFPSSSNSINTNIFVLNEYLYSDNRSFLFIKKTGNGENVLITDELVKNMEQNINMYLFKITSIESKQFIKDIGKWYNAFNFKTGNDIYFNDFGISKKPKSIQKDPKMDDHLKQLSILLSVKK